LGGPRPPNPAALRHAFITAALDAGVPLHDVQEATSHADPRTTDLLPEKSSAVAADGAPHRGRRGKPLPPPGLGENLWSGKNAAGHGGAGPPSGSASAA